MNKGLTAGQQNGLRARWWYEGWIRAERNLPRPDIRRIATYHELKVTFRMCAAVVRKEINEAMGWWPTKL